MKKIMLVMITVLFAMLSGCGKSSDSTGPSNTSPMAGTWNLTTTNGVAPVNYTQVLIISADGSWSYTATITGGGTCTGSGTSTSSGGSMTIVTNTDNCTNPAPTLPSTQTGTYSVTSTTLTMVLGSDTHVYTKQ